MEFRTRILKRPALMTASSLIDSIVERESLKKLERERLETHMQRDSAFFVAAVILTLLASGCMREEENGDNRGAASAPQSQAASDRDGDAGEGEHGRGELGEESGTELALHETYDSIRGGARLILSYDSAKSSFVGSVENTTNETLKRVRVEVHLANGQELGPTNPTDLDPGEARDVELSAAGQVFDGWTAHPEVGDGEHGHGEHDGEHDEDRDGEH